jgi:hypothetical protein
VYSWLAGAAVCASTPLLAAMANAKKPAVNARPMRLMDGMVISCNR